MHDWTDVVRQRLGPLGLDPQRESEIVEELADHLADLYAEIRHECPDDQAAIARVLSSIPITPQLARKIARAEREEDDMNQRVKTVWLPGLLTMALSAGLLWMMIHAGVQPIIIWHNPNQPLLVLCLPWLALLPAIGSIGAYLSKRAGGQVGQRLLAGAFPAVAMLGLFAIMFPVALVVDSHVPLALRLFALAAGTVNSILIPGALLLLGAIPLLNLHPNAPSQGKA